MALEAAEAARWQGDPSPLCPIDLDSLCAPIGTLCSEEGAAVGSPSTGTHATRADQLLDSLFVIKTTSFD